MKESPTGTQLQNIIEDVRKLVKEEQYQYNLKCSTSDEFLVRFIKASHYDVKVSFTLIKKYFKAKIDHPEAFIVQSPASNLKMIQRKDLGLPLKDKDKCGRRILHFKFGKLDPAKEDWLSAIQTVMMCLEAFSLEEDVQDHGVTFILDCKEFSLKIMKWATPNKIKITLGFFQYSIPLRFEAVHIINYPYVFNVLYSAIKPFLHEETKKKLIWHSNLSTLEEHIEKKSLPVELEGELMNHEVENWYTTVTEKEDTFAEFRKMGYPT